MDRQTRIDQAIGQEIGANAAQVAAAVRLLDEGATVPFIARYRKEATGGLDDTQLRNLADRLTYLRELGVDADDVPRLARTTLDDACLATNPRAASEGDVLQLFRDAL